MGSSRVTIATRDQVLDDGHWPATAGSVFFNRDDVARLRDSDWVTLPRSPPLPEGNEVFPVEAVLKVEGYLFPVAPGARHVVGGWGLLV